MDKEIIRSSMVFYESFYSATDELPDDMFRLAWKCICEYAFYGIEPEDIPLPIKLVFKLVKPNIDKVIVMREGGSSGGRPKKPRVSDSKPRVLKSKPKVTNGKTLPIYDVDVDDDVDVEQDDDVDVDRQTDEDGSAGQSGSHTKPSFKEVADEVAEKGFRVSSSKFFEHYEKNGWKTNEGEPIRDWKKMLAVWDMKERFGVSPESSGKSKPKKNAFNNFDQREYSNDDLEARYLSKG